MKTCDKKGYTFIELILVLGLMILILGMMAPILANTFKVYRRIECTVELSEQGQFSLDYMTSKLIKLKNIKTIKDRKDGSKNRINSCVPIEIRSIEFEEIDSDGLLRKNLFDLRSNNKLFEGPAEVGDYITHIIIEPLPQGATYGKAGGMKIKMILEKDHVKQTVQQSVSFRNKSYQKNY